MASAASGKSLILEDSQRLRLFTLFILYVGQGMPIGLFWFAVPAWMAVKGAPAADVGSVAALTALPWSLKLVNGFIMDRYTFLPMGRRRAWILGAQLVMIACLLIAALIEPSVKDVAILGGIGFALNLATTFQDVAVDGLAVDIMTEDERARGSGMMFGGQAIGIAAATAICGFVIGDFGAPAAFLIVAALIFVLCVYIASFRERQGERSMPWSSGRAHERNLEIQLDAWWPLLKSTFNSMRKSSSLLWLPCLFGRGVLYGGFAGATPLIGANYVGWDTAEISSLTATAGLLAGVLCMTLGGWLGDRYGAKRIGIMWVASGIAMCAVMFGAVEHWSNSAVFMAFVYFWIPLDMLITVALLPISMRLCDPTVAATQFTIYMAVSNFGISFGAIMLGKTEALGGLPSIFIIVAAGLSVALLLLLTAKFPRRPEYYEIQKRREIMAAHKPA
ncbi:MFS transporter [Qipengyuania nanhaisediminis]|uniref:Predicted arabinose efflux permease, MFS family n=1 Tax=Qipengyuania nanhaisediminis TaxID=604088 RepID=A0A1I5MF47_9SPHN|nr:MFS transporter [Qipengyuania nanhaisediminis]SFP07586.1 Predicted arabinose efflux permease, MFS family [Qipengyuania nanhaisediminis]